MLCMLYMYIPVVLLPVGTHGSGRPDATPHALLIEYTDGFRGAVLRVGDDNARWNLACTVRGELRSTRVVVGERSSTVALN